MRECMGGLFRRSNVAEEKKDDDITESLCLDTSSA